ncbi:MAG TPA: type IV pilus modification protein PilV [Aeromonadales bacterium]|nr:type IV pilus modification protein PilV [Aeromonadales bacterium]
MYKKIKSKKGFSLLEVLISMVIIAVGLLGIAGLQIAGINNNHSAYVRSQATVLANDIIDRMRANRISAENGNYDLTIAESKPSGTSLEDIDRKQWLDNIANILPEGDASIATSSGGGNTIITITIQWNDSRGANGSTTQQFKTETVL